MENFLLVFVKNIRIVVMFVYIALKKLNEKTLIYLGIVLIMVAFVTMWYYFQNMELRKSEMKKFQSFRSEEKASRGIIMDLTAPRKEGTEFFVSQVVAPQTIKNLSAPEKKEK